MRCRIIFLLSPLVSQHTPRPEFTTNKYYKFITRKRVEESFTINNNYFRGCARPPDGLFFLQHRVALLLHHVPMLIFLCCTQSAHFLLFFYTELIKWPRVLRSIYVSGDRSSDKITIYSLPADRTTIKNLFTCTILCFSFASVRLVQCARITESRLCYGMDLVVMRAKN